MSSWFTSLGTLYHGFGGRWKLGGIAPAEAFDEAVTKGQLAEFDGTLNIDFTDTLDFFTGNQAISFGEAYLQFVGWVPLQYDAEAIGSSLVNTDREFYQFVGEGETELLGLGITFPTASAGNLLLVKTGPNSGSAMSNVITYTDQSGLGGSEQYTSQMFTVAVDAGTGERNAYSISQTVDSNGGGLFISKINDDGENVDFQINDTSTGFKIYNDLSDNEASLLDIRDNSGDTIFEVRNDGLFVGPNIPTADPLVLGQIWLDGDTLKVSAGAP